MTHKTLTGATISRIMYSEDLLNYYIALALHIGVFVCTKRITLLFKHIYKMDLKLKAKLLQKLFYE